MGNKLNHVSSPQKLMERLLFPIKAANTKTKKNKWIANENMSRLVQNIFSLHLNLS